MSDDLEDFCTVRAIFRPQKLDTLRPVFEPYKGREGTFKYAGHMDEGPYKDQMIFFVDDTWGEDVRGYWLPREDLEVLSVSYPYRVSAETAGSGTSGA